QSYFDILGHWSSIPEALEAAGNQVYVTEVDPLNSPMLRGERLTEQLEEIAQTDGHAKFVLIGHSQGGLDIRYVASTRPAPVGAELRRQHVLPARLGRGHGRDEPVRLAPQHDGRLRGRVIRGVPGLAGRRLFLG